ncbi:MAG: two pore domain potassium channel family protein, partial [Chloroflexi bacterium]|nr:two pore domain potassium channel family protein [Chloroflexota bacterium]
RVLWKFEQFVVLAYIAVVVSRLVGLTLQQRSRSRS